jgi:hypothetical protein
MRNHDRFSTLRAVRVRLSTRRSSVTDKVHGQRAVATIPDVKAQTLVWAMEAADPVDERNGPLAHSALENATRFPQLPQPEFSRVSQTTTTRAGLSLAGPLCGLEYGVHLSVAFSPGLHLHLHLHQDRRLRNQKECLTNAGTSLKVLIPNVKNTSNAGSGETAQVDNPVCVYMTCSRVDSE